VERQDARRRVDPRWVRLTALTAVIAFVSGLAGYAASLLPIGGEETRRMLGAAVIGCCGAVGFSWIVVLAFNAFDVDSKFRDGPP